MQVLILLLCIFVTFFGVYGVCMLLGYNSDNSNRMKAQIRDLEWRGKQINAGINPDGLPYDFDHSCDLDNANNPSERCKQVNAENDVRIQRDAQKLRELLK